MQARGKQAELVGALRAGLPPEWWGAPAGPDAHILGSRLQLCQVGPHLPCGVLLVQGKSSIMHESLHLIMPYSTLAGAQIHYMSVS